MGGGDALTDYPSVLIAVITNSYGLTEIINQQTNFEPNRNPACIDPIFSSQPDMTLKSGTLSSLLTETSSLTCSSQRFNIKPPLSYEKKSAGLQKC